MPKWRLKKASYPLHQKRIIRWFILESRIFWGTLIASCRGFQVEEFLNPLNIVFHADRFSFDRYDSVNNIIKHFFSVRSCYRLKNIVIQLNVRFGNLLFKRHFGIQCRKFSQIRKKHWKTYECKNKPRPNERKIV